MAHGDPRDPLRDLLRDLWGDVALCLAFYTRLRLPTLGRGAARSFADAQWAAPLAGLAVAAGAGAAFHTATLAGLDAGPAAALALTASILFTGCLHEDGLADTADGFGGGATRVRKLEIFRDSRIGTYGASALVLSVLLRWSALADLAAPGAVWAALAAAHMASRGWIALFLHWLPPARSEGLSAGVGRPATWAVNIAVLLGLLALLTLGLAPALVTALLLALGLAGFRVLCLRQIGGHTGDTVGALQQGGEIIVLLCAAAVLS